ncbi:MAG: protein kinase [Acidobacteria bacterium]|nr:protein kinase [Acidobacteriota bacterium]
MTDYSGLLNRMIDSYQVTELLGQGGMGAVFKAYDHQNHRWVGLKIINPKLLTQRELIEQFRLEAEAATGLNHYNIAQLYYIGNFQNVPYYTMEFIEGKSFADLLKERGRLAGTSSINYLYQICNGLEYCAANGIIHRDIKPANLMITNDGIVKVVDFGLAMVLQEGYQSSEAEQILGTPKYISPEAGTTKLLDLRSDIYSLGATFYHLMAGEPPFHASTPFEYLKKHINEPLIPLKERNPLVPELISDIIYKMMEKNPKDRYQSYKEIKDDIDAAKKTGFRKTHDFEVKTTATASKTKEKKKQPVFLFILIGVFIVAVIVFMILQNQIEQKKLEAEKEVKTEEELDFDNLKVPTQRSNNPYASPGPGPYSGSPMAPIRDAGMARTRANMMNVRVAVSMYIAAKNEMPSSLDEVVTETGIPGNVLYDFWGSKLKLIEKGDFDFSIGSSGPDRVWGTADDIELGN